MRIITLDMCVRRRGTTWPLVIAVLALSSTVLAYLAWTSGSGNGDDRLFSILAGDDPVRIDEALGAMDRLGGFGITDRRVDEMIESGLLDPGHQNPIESGMPAPDFELMPLRFYDFAIDRGVTKRTAGALFEPVRLIDFRGRQPVVLIMGSHTWPPFTDRIDELDELADKYKGQAQFFVIYIEEALPFDDRTGRLDDDQLRIKDPEDLSERSMIANSSMSVLDVAMPCLVDDMENTAARAYRSWPARMFVIGTDGDVAWVGAPGPLGLRADPLEAALVSELAGAGVRRY